jgi:quinoprotein glucose dehydrogenase
MDKAPLPARKPPRLYAVFLALIALALLFGGGWLAGLGGSPYYLIAGIALAACVVALWRGRRWGMWLYGAITVATVAWAVWEAGFSGWALMPRLVAWFVVGSWMVTPWFRRSLTPPAKRPVLGAAAFVGALGAALLVGHGLHSLSPDPADPIYKTGMGSYPAQRMPLRAAASDWQHYGNDQGGSRFSPLTQITPANVSGLKTVWSTSIMTTPDSVNQGLEATPIMIGDSLYVCNGANDVFALDAETGKRRWVAPIASSKGRTCRGVAYYRVPDASGPCAERIIAATGDADLFALDARTGARCAGFGKNGAVNLLAGLSKSPARYYYVTSAPAIVRGKIVVGGRVSDGQYWGEPSGVIRAFDAVTGELSWAWDMAHPERTGMPPEGETYTHSTPNSWAPISADEQLGLVYLPIGNATPDYFGAQRRPFDDKYSSSVVALDADTGRLRWYFQTLHHDLWDFDVASQPTLVDLPDGRGGARRALVQPTKAGEVYLLDRVTGKPIKPVVERPVSQRGGVPEERLSPTQPFSIGLPSFRGADLRERDMWGLTPLDQIYCRIKFKKARYDGVMTPPGLTPWISSPGYIGGMDWGGVSVDPDRGIMIANSSTITNYNYLLTRADADKRGMKPTGGNASADENAGPVPQFGTPYAAHVEYFKSPLGMPCQEPPYGRLSAVDLVTGKLLWVQALGKARKTGPMGIPITAPFVMGTPTTGGSMNTRTGIAFIAATQDKTLRAFEVATGKLLWEGALPQGGFASPMSYIAPKSGRQFVVIAAGGSHGLGETGGANVVAFALK